MVKTLSVFVRWLFFYIFKQQIIIYIFLIVRIFVYDNQNIKKLKAQKLTFKFNYCLIDYRFITKIIKISFAILRIY